MYRLRLTPVGDLFRRLGAKTITPSLFHVPPETEAGTSQIVWGGPPEMSSFLSCPGANAPGVDENAMYRLSGDQKTGGGSALPLSVPASGRTSTESSARSHMRVTPSVPAAGSTTHLPFGETIG